MPDRDACPGCGAELAPAFLVCPRCHHLVHTEELKRLAEEAERAASAGDPRAALLAWRRALDLLPPGSRQHQQVSAKVSALAAVVPSVDAAPRPPWQKGAAAAGGFGLVLWKIKWILLVLLGKGKLLLLGLTKLPTLLSMVLAFGVYFTAFGWKFALGLLVTTYIHEMGHVATLRRFGVAATAPMFLPGIGAFVRVKQAFTDVRQDARSGIAGPIWGAAAAAGAWAVSRATDWPSWAAIAHVAAAINLFNLIPIGFLDGGRAFKTLTRSERLGIAAAAGVALLVSGQGVAVILVAILAASLVRAAEKTAPTRSDPEVFWELVALLAFLTLLGRGPVRT